MANYLASTGTSFFNKLEGLTSALVSGVQENLIALRREVEINIQSDWTDTDNQLSVEHLLTYNANKDFSDEEDPEGGDFQDPGTWMQRNKKTGKKEKVKKLSAAEEEERRDAFDKSEEDEDPEDDDEGEMSKGSK